MNHEAGFRRDAPCALGMGQADWGKEERAECGRDGPAYFRPPGGGLVPAHGALGAALLVALWNTMGWDNASTVAREVERPQRTYIVAMLGAVAVVTVSYVLPVAASAAAGVSASEFATGAWVEVARRLSGGGLLDGSAGRRTCLR